MGSDVEADHPFIGAPVFDEQSSVEPSSTVEAIVILLDQSTTISMNRLVDEIEDAIERAAMPPERVSLGGMDVSIDLVERTAWVGDDPLRLTGREFDVLALLASHAGRVVSRKMILESVWGPDQSVTSLNVHVNALRAKLKRPDVIQTVHGIGYRLGEPLKRIPSESTGRRLQVLRNVRHL